MTLLTTSLGQLRYRTLFEPSVSKTSPIIPKGPCTQIVYTLALKYLYRDYIKAKVYAIWAHGPLGYRNLTIGSVKQP